MAPTIHSPPVIFLPHGGGGGARKRAGGGSKARAAPPSVSFRFASLDTSPMLGEESNAP
jgi:hypothetical protein